LSNPPEETDTMPDEPPRRQQSALRRVFVVVGNGTITFVALLAWGLFGLAYYLDRMSRDLALIGAGAAFLSAGMLAEWALRRAVRPPSSQDSAWNDALADGLGGKASQWDRAFLLGARELQRRIVMATIPLAICFIVATVLPWPLQPMALAFGLVLMVASFVRIARFSALQASQRVLKRVFGVIPPADDPRE
jgi:hypothetical protein